MAGLLVWGDFLDKKKSRFDSYPDKPSSHIKITLKGVSSTEMYFQTFQIRKMHLLNNINHEEKAF